MDAPPSVFRTQLRLHLAPLSKRAYRDPLLLTSTMPSDPPDGVFVFVFASIFAFFLCHCLCRCLRTLPAKSQAFNLLLSAPRGKKKANSDSTSTTSQDPLVKEISGKNGTHMVPSASLLCERVEWINRSSGRGQALKPLNTPHSGR